MALEALLAYAHLLAILTVVVFISSEASLCRPEWMNAKIVDRLARVDMVYGIAAGVLLLTGLARTFWGMKGAGWYWSNPLLHVKLAMFIMVGLISIKPTIVFRRWKKELAATGALPSDIEVRKTRKLVMVQAHIIALIPLVAVFLARGFGK